MRRMVHLSKSVLVWLCSCILWLCNFSVQAQVRLDLESGLVLGTPYNEIRIPNQGGTYVNLTDHLQPKPTVFYRIRLGYTLADRHTISLLYAPLTVRYQGEFGQDVLFTNQLFAANRPVSVDYTFNSYRLTYRYDFIARPQWRVGVGLTAKIRDANVQFTSETIHANFANVGFVPLINVLVAYQPDKHWRMWLEGDALGSRFGRAEDIFVGGAYALSQAIQVKAGYRVVEGGANVDEVYNFTFVSSHRDRKS